MEAARNTICITMYIKYIINTTIFIQETCQDMQLEFGITYDDY